MALELLVGRDLSWVYREALNAGRPIPIEVAVYVAHEAAKALAHAHALCDDAGESLQLVHRDVTPANLMLLRNGRVKVLDFGVAKVEWAQRESETQGGEIKGKLAYLSPEQLGQAKLDHRADLFSLGVVMWELLTGKRLFWAATAAETVANVVRAPIVPPSQHRADVSPALDAIVLRALERDPERRFGSAGELVDALATGGSRRERRRAAAEFLASLKPTYAAEAAMPLDEPGSVSQRGSSGGVAAKPTTGRYRGVGRGAVVEERPALVFDDATVIDDRVPAEEGTVTRVYTTADAARLASAWTPGDPNPLAAAIVTRELAPVDDAVGPAPEAPRVDVRAGSGRRRAAVMFSLGAIAASAAFALLTPRAMRSAGVGGVGSSGAFGASAVAVEPFAAALGALAPSPRASAPIVVPEPAPAAPPRKVVRRSPRRRPGAPAQLDGAIGPPGEPPGGLDGPGR
jgi:hypothetical protein